MGYGYSGHDAAASSSLLADQPSYDLDINDILDSDSGVLSARGAHNVRNNAYAIALINANQSGIVGPEGLKFKSKYNAAATDEENIQLRKDIDACIKKGTTGTRLDAAGLLSLRQIQDAWVTGKAIYGNSVFIRVPVPNRPGATHSHAWRQINCLRISNPHYKQNTKTLRSGVELDQSGRPIALHIASQHPNASGNTRSNVTWSRVELYDEDGLEQVIWHAHRIAPEQIWGSPWIAPILGLLVHLGKVTEAHVVAKRLQACMGLIIESPDPVAAAKADRAGVVWTKDTTITPGKNYYVRLGTKVTAFDFKFDGQDYENFTNALLQAICAGFGSGVPWQYVMQQLTKSNMASARAALMQAYRSFRRNQIDHEHELRIILKNLLAEDIARGRLNLPTGDDLDAAIEGYFVPPQRLTTDPHRDAQAATAMVALGVSKTTALREFGGYDYDMELQQTAADNEAAETQGVSQTPIDPAAGAAAAAAIAAIDAADELDDEDPDKTDDSEDDDEDNKLEDAA